MLSEERGILSPVRLPVPPLQRVGARRFFEYNKLASQNMAEGGLVCGATILALWPAQCAAYPPK